MGDEHAEDIFICEEYKEQIAELKDENDLLMQKQSKSMMKTKQLRATRDKLQKERDELKAKVDLYEGKSERINAMDMSELNALEFTLQGTLQNVQSAKED